MIAMENAFAGRARAALAAAAMIAAMLTSLPTQAAGDNVSGAVTLRANRPAAVSGGAVIRGDRRFIDYRDIDRPANRYQTTGSIIILREPVAVWPGGDHDGGRYGSAADDGIAIRGTSDLYGSQSVDVSDFETSLRPDMSSGHIGPKIIDVGSARLDRRPIGPGGISTIYAGGAKIIRIAAGYRGASRISDTADERPEAPTPPRTTGLEPWSDGWATYCRRVHRNFDPARGTYVAKDGQTRFCSAD